MLLAAAIHFAIDGAARRSVAATGDHPHHPGQDYPSRGGFAGSTRDGGTFGISVSMAGASAVLFFWREANIFSARCSHRSASPSNFQRLSGSHAACCRQSKAVARYASALLSPRSMKVLPACNVRVQCAIDPRERKTLTIAPRSQSGTDSDHLSILVGRVFLARTGTRRDQVRGHASPDDVS